MHDDLIGYFVKHEMAFLLAHSVQELEIKIATFDISIFTVYAVKVIQKDIVFFFARGG